jgi:hypothetical protein
MSYTLIGFLLAAGLFLGMLISLEVGRRRGMRRLKEEGDEAFSGSGAIESAVFGLLGLLIAFTFFGAAERFDRRRELIVEETNFIGTAYLRIGLLPADLQPAMREYFRRYLDARLAFYKKLPDLAAATEELELSTELQGQIWRQSLSASQTPGSADASRLLLPALNEMFDITTTRTMAMQMHPPTIVFVMLFGLAFASALIAGYGMARSKSRKWLHVIVFCAVLAAAVYVILDLEFPRLGLIRVDDFDQSLVDLRAQMK